MPKLLVHEPRLGVAPIRLEKDHAEERLDRTSRVNYNKLVTVEHTVKVYFIGRVVKTDMDIVNNAVDDCWEAKHKISARKHHRNRRRN